MLLTFTAIDKQAQLRDFSCWLTSLEGAFDALSAISLAGNQLIKAEIIDNEQHTVLPVEAFNGEIFSESIQQLENQWRQILTPLIKPVSKADQWLIKLTRQRIRSIQIGIEQSCRMIDQLEIVLQGTKALICSELQRVRLITRYELMIRSKRNYLATLRDQQNLVLNRLAQLDEIYANRL
ncbi:hypothetical protein [Spirosoma flavum]|uniref:PH domain-containing protein n=1 Tax=Spirosoma flavum TaxID=2048557 RepID=A0ABW6AIV0_9BACT